MSKIHKRKDTKKMLFKKDGSWNIMCNVKSTHIRTTDYWESVTCRNCLRKRTDKNV